jgi:hypothetical protein
MSSSNLYLRSDADKGESSPSKNLRLRSESDKEAGLTPGWNKLAYASEPPTPGAWNKVAYDSEPPTTGVWNKLKYGD